MVKHVSARQFHRSDIMAGMEGVALMRRSHNLPQPPQREDVEEGEGDWSAS